MVNPRLPMVAAALFGAAALTAQVPKGNAAPSFDFKAVLNDGPESFEDLAGKALQKLMAKYDRSNANKERKLMEALHKFCNAKKHRGTHAAAKARKTLDG